MRVCEALKFLTEYFYKKKIEAPRVDAELLLAHVLGYCRLDLFLNYQQQLTEDQITVLRSCSVRRGHREPLQYILGSVEFYGQTLRVTPDVLIPRPETEELVHQLIQYFETHEPPHFGIDLGTGSGAIAIALTGVYPQLTMVAVDQSLPALDVAYDNAIQNRVQKQIRFVHSSWFEKIKEKFDFIVTNPPYLSHKELEAAQPEVRCFEPQQALIAKEEGLSDLKHILYEARIHLNPHGVIVMETGLGQHEALHTWAQAYGYKKTQSTLDLSHKERYFWGWIA